MSRKFDLQIFSEGGVTPFIQDGGGVPDSVVTNGTGTNSILGERVTTNAAVPQTDGQGIAPFNGTAPSGGSKPYEAFRLPEGMRADEEQIKAAGALFGEMGLTQEQAQRLVDFHTKHWIGAVDAYETELNRKVAEWGEMTKVHPDFGGARLNDSLTSVRRAIGKVGGGELERALTETGAINHPEVFGAFVRLGRMFAEDSFVEVDGFAKGAAAAGGSPSDMARRVYPDMRHS